MEKNKSRVFPVKVFLGSKLNQEYIEIHKRLDKILFV